MGSQLMVSLGYMRGRVRMMFDDNKDVIKLPIAEHSFIYGGEEWGEAMRAYIKAQRPGDLRNQPALNLDFRAEIGDYKMMLLATTLGDTRGNYEGWYVEDGAVRHGGLTQIEQLYGSITMAYDVYEKIISGKDFSKGIMDMLEWLDWTNYENDELSLAIRKMYRRAERERENLRTPNVDPK